MWVWAPGVAFGADRLVPSQYATVQAAVNAAVSGVDRVVVAAGTHSGDVDVNGKAVTIVGQGSGATALDGGSGEVVRVFNGGDLVLEDLAVTSANLRKCIDVAGAGATLVLVDAWIHGCGNGTGNGGGLHADPDTVVTITRTTFQDNSASRGGHVYFWGTSLDIADSAFVDGVGTSSEGGIHVTGSADVTIRRTILQGNDATGSGGALSFEGDDLVVEESTFDGNHADDDGGALFSGGAGGITIFGSVFVDNTADVRAGAIDLSGVPDVEVRRSWFCGNVGGWSTGGAVRLYDTGDGALYSWANNVFLGNAGDWGGGVYLTAARARFENDTFVANDAWSSGGAIELSSSALGQVDVVNTLFLDTLGGSAVDVGTGLSTFSSAWTDWWNNLPADYSGNVVYGPGPTDLFVDPALQSSTGICLTDELWPAVGSPLVDAGDPSLSDPDGTRSDLGAWGGPDPICALADSYVDADGDGFGTGGPVRRDCAPPVGYADNDLDCDDADPAVGTDRTWYRDADGDGQGNASQTTQACAQPAGWVANATDCDDADATTYLGAQEVCGGGDDDCDGLADDADPSTTGEPAWYDDTDGDGFGDLTPTYRCAAPPGNVAASGDCDDGDAAVHPGASEGCDGADNDCDGSPDPSELDGDGDGLAPCDGDCDDADPQVGLPPTWYRDQDADGQGDPSQPTAACAVPPGYVANATDCDDLDPSRYVGATEVCGGGDEDCDALVDDADPSVTGTLPWYDDADADGFGAGLPSSACAPPAGTVAAANDCDDADPAVHPGAAEVCGGGDEDCDALVDDLDPSVDPATLGTFFADADGDGFGDPSAATAACAPSPGLVPDDTDCDDQEALVHPGALEQCNLRDDDCDDAVDEAVVFVDWYVDADGDGWGDGLPVNDCRAPGPDWVLSPGDCDDALPGVNPDALELCDGLDQDCDGLADEGLPTSDWRYDGDGDGFGVDAITVPSCGDPGADWSAAGGDCDDADLGVHPGASEGCDGLDTDCTGGPSPDELDADADGSPACAGDCDDAEPAVGPGAEEHCDGVDEDCDGEIDEGAVDAVVAWPDADGDGYGDASAGPSASCDPVGAPDGTDCDDADPDVHPGADEQPGNGLDDDCDPATGDGAVDPPDRSVDEDTAAKGDPSGCGCAAGPGVPWLAALPLLALRRRPRLTE